MRAANLILITLLGGASACVVGKSAAEWPVAKQPQGATVTLRSNPATVTGELIEVTEDGVVLKTTSGKLVFAPFSTIDHLAAAGLGAEFRMGRRMPPTRAARANLVMISHFPQGMTPEIRQRMLAVSGQSQIEPLQ